VLGGDADRPGRPDEHGELCHHCGGDGPVVGRALVKVYDDRCVVLMMMMGVVAVLVVMLVLQYCDARQATADAQRLAGGVTWADGRPSGRLIPGGQAKQTGRYLLSIDDRLLFGY